MTQRETLARYLAHCGCRLMQRTEKRWSYMNDHTGQRYYLGASGSWRVGPSFSASRPVSDRAKAEALAWAGACATRGADELL
jgi:hypothetical protein